ncbi:MAG: alpha/beta hydrolase [Chryseolinea sp.]
MALSREVLDNIALFEKMGFDKINHVPVAQTREAMKHVPPSPNPTAVGQVINYTIADGDIPIRLYIPVGEGPFPSIAFFHGGGFSIMSIDSTDEICRHVCVDAMAIVMSVEYRLAPEHAYPAGPHDCLAATKWLIKNAPSYNGLPEVLAVAGESAGGYMALWVAQKLHREGFKLKAQFAAYPVTDHYSANHRSYDENKVGYILTAELMRWFWDNYLTDPTKFEEASPLREKDFKGLAPALIMTANYCPLRDEGKAYADKLAAAGVPTDYINYENVHGFLGSGTMGIEALKIASAYLYKHLKDIIN